MSNVVSSTTSIYIRHFIPVMLNSSMSHSSYHLPGSLWLIPFSFPLFLPQKIEFLFKQNHKVVKIIYIFPRRKLNANMVSLTQAKGSNEKIFQQHLHYEKVLRVESTNSVALHGWMADIDTASASTPRRQKGNSGLLLHSWPHQTTMA